MPAAVPVGEHEADVGHDLQVVRDRRPADRQAIDDVGRVVDASGPSRPPQQARPADQAPYGTRPAPPVPADHAPGTDADAADDISAHTITGDKPSVQGVPSGAKFETFAYLDRVLGMDLAREVGHQHRMTP